MIKKEFMNRVPKESLMMIVESIANQHYSGHYTLLTFTTNVKFSFSTITEREDILELTPYTDINDAIENAIQQHLMELKKSIKNRSNVNFKVKPVAKIPKL